MGKVRTYQDVLKLSRKVRSEEDWKILEDALTQGITKQYRRKIENELEKKEKHETGGHR